MIWVIIGLLAVVWVAWVAYKDSKLKTKLTEEEERDLVTYLQKNMQHAPRYSIKTGRRIK